MKRLKKVLLLKYDIEIVRRMNMIYEYSLKTDKEGFYNITREVRDAVKKSGVTSGIAVVHCPHTTAGITINENADPDVVKDMLLGLVRRLFQKEESSGTAKEIPQRILNQARCLPSRLS